MSKIPQNFRGYAGDPRSELDVAFLLGLVYDYLPFQWVVRSLNDTFPDCEGIDPATGKPVRVEPEVLSHNYLSHGHPMKGCDHIVCWQDNWPESPIPVIALDQLIKGSGLEANRFIFVPRPGSPLQELEDLKETNFEVFEVIDYFLNDSIPRIREKPPHIYADVSLTKHFCIRDGTGYGFLGFYPQGKLTCFQVDEAVDKH